LLVAEPEVHPKASLYGAVRFLTVFGTLGILACLALYLLSHSFKAGIPVGIRSLAAILLPILGGSFVFVLQRSSLRRFREVPAGVAFLGSLSAGALIMAALRFLVDFSPIPVAELLVASCISVLVFAADSLPRLAFDVPQASEDRPIALFYGVASGMLLYIVLFGFPRLGAA
jgi:hypothetical protein